MNTQKFEMIEFDVNSSARNVLDECFDRYVRSRSDRTPFVLALDGRDGSGKSSLSRWLAHSLSVAQLSGDFFLNPLDSAGGPWNSDQYEIELLTKLIDRIRFKGSGEFLIFESVFACRILELCGVKPDFLVRCVERDTTGSWAWKKCFEDYEMRFTPDLEHKWCLQETPQAIRQFGEVTR